jgi:hypothetical protein
VPLPWPQLALQHPPPSLPLRVLQVLRFLLLLVALVSQLLLLVKLQAQLVPLPSPAKAKAVLALRSCPRKANRHWLAVLRYPARPLLLGLWWLPAPPLLPPPLWRLLQETLVLPRSSVLSLSLSLSLLSWPWFPPPGQFAPRLLCPPLLVPLLQQLLEQVLPVLRARLVLLSPALVMPWAGHPLLQLRLLAHRRALLVQPLILRLLPPLPPPPLLPPLPPLPPLLPILPLPLLPLPPPPSPPLPQSIREHPPPPTSPSHSSSRLPSSAACL